MTLNGKLNACYVKIPYRYSLDLKGTFE
jgi:hypothetical protein